MEEKKKNAAGVPQFPALDRSKMPTPTRLYEIIISDISDKIAKGILKPGDLLPSERELAEQFQLSRVPVREALKILEFLGVLNLVPGKGMYVQPLEVPALVSKIFFGLNTDPENVRQLFEVRLLLETYAARSAAIHHTDAELSELYSTLCADSDSDANPLQESIGFHNCIIQMAHNNIISEFYKFLSSLLVEARTCTRMVERFQNQPMHYHMDIYEAIQQRDGDRAAQLMREHLISEMKNL